MNTITRTPPAGANSPTGAPAPGDGGQVAASGASGLNLAAVLELLKQATGGSSGSGGSDGNAPPGAPALQQPDLDFSPESMAIEIQALMDKTNELQSNAEGQSIKLTQQQQQDAHAKNIVAIDKAVKKIAAAKKKQKALGILGIIGKAFAVVAAVVMTVVSAGALAAVAGVICAYAVTDLAMSVASTVNQSKGGKDISLETLTTEGLTTALEKTGHSQADSEKIGGYLSLGLQCTIALATLAVGVGGAAGLIGGATSTAAETGAEVAAQATSEAAAEATAQATSETATQATSQAASEAISDAPAEAASETTTQATTQASSKTTSQAAGETSLADSDDEAEGSPKLAEAAGRVRRGAKLTQITGQVMNSFNTAASGGLSISKAYDDRDAADAQADQIRFQAMLDAMQTLIDDSIDRVKDLAQQASSDTQSTTDMIKTAHDSKMATAAPAATV